MAKRLQLLSEQLGAGTLTDKPQFGNVYIVAAKRTPIGSYMGKLSHLKAPQLGAICIKEALSSISVSPQNVDEVIMGNVLSAGVGQAPARQAAILAGVNVSATCTTINKVCSSGMKSIIYGAQSIALGQQNLVVAGGFESMSNAPHLVMNARKGVGHGNKILIDSLTYDGLTDPFKHISMGLCAEKTAKQMQITRQSQDKYCQLTFQRHIQAQQKGFLKEQIIPITIKSKGQTEILDRDEEALRYKKDIISKLRPAFDKNGTVTSANASKINDGACCLILMSEDELKKSKVKPLARIVSYADAEIESVDFCKSPYFSTVKALKLGGLTASDINFYEFNEAFSVVPIAIMKMLNIPEQKINILGGAVAMGHPIGMSGARIVQSLLTTLKLKGGKYGAAGICNGGGGSSAIIIQNLQ